MLYIPAWLSALAFSSVDAQIMSMYALRSHGWEAHGGSYGDDFYWETRKPGSEFWCRITPVHKP